MCVARAQRWYLTAVVVLAWCALAATYARPLLDTASDDAFITYRYADNLAQGRGLVFNSGERVLGTTEPAWALVLAAAGRLTGVPVHRLGTILYGVSLVALALVLVASVASQAPRLLPEALAAGTLVVASPYLWVARGFSWPAALALLVGAAAVCGRRPLTAGLLAGAAVLFRPEAGLGVALLGLLLVAERWRRPGRRGEIWRFALGAGAVLGAGLLAAWAYYGAALPHTWAAKQAASDGGASPLALWSAYWSAAWPHRQRSFGAATPYWAALALVGVPAAWSAGAGPRLIVPLGAVLALVHPLLGVPFFQWYGVPMVVAALVSAPFGVGAAARWLARREPAALRIAGVVAVAAAAVLLVAPMVPRAERLLRHGSGAVFLDTYRRAGLWLREHSPPDADFTLTEIGIAAYYADRRVVDLMGLVTPRAVAHVAARDVRTTLLEQPTEYVLVHDLRPRMRGLAGTAWFQAAYEEVAEHADLRGEGRLVIYRRRPEAVRVAPAGA